MKKPLRRLLFLLNIPQFFVNVCVILLSFYSKGFILCEKVWFYVFFFANFGIPFLKMYRIAFGCIFCSFLGWV